MNFPARAAGSALITAIFLILVVVALGASMVSLSTVQQDTAVKAVLASRVYYGAKAGLEWAVQRVITDAAPPARCTGGTFPATFSPAGDGLSGVSVTVTCASSQHGAGTTSFTYYITSTATTGSLGTLSYAERRMEATVSNIP
jgi:MSHA biogenesis protein MshP